MNALRTLCTSLIFTILILSGSLWAQATTEVNYTTFLGKSATARLALPLYAVRNAQRIPFFRQEQRNRLPLEEVETIRLGEDTLFRRFPGVDPHALWQLLVWGDYSLYRSVGLPEESTFVLTHQEEYQHLHDRNFMQELNGEARRKSKPIVSAKSRYGAPQLTRAVRKLNQRYGEQAPFVYTPFEVSRWQLETGVRMFLTSPFVLRTVREQDFGLAYHLGLNRRLFNHLPHFWLHFGLDYHNFRGNNTQLVIRQPDFLRSLRYTDWQTALGVRIEAAPQWGMSPYIGANLVFNLPTQVEYVQRSDPNRPRPSGLPFLVEQRGQGRLSVGNSFLIGARIQFGDFWSFHAQYAAVLAPGAVRFFAPEGSSEIALSGDVRWPEFYQQVLQFHLQFAIR